MSAAPAKILLVDDRPENLLALEAVLEPLGQDLVTASSGEEALRLLLVNEFAVVLLDVQMPGIDGFETATLVKERERTRHVPIIFLTAHDKGIEHVFRGYESGAVDYILKPFHPEVLRSKVVVFVDLFTQGRALQESEERFRRSFDDAAIGMALVDTEGRWIKVNRSLCQITRYSEAELLATTTHEITPHARDLHADREQMEAVVRGDLPSYRIEKRLIRADGEPVWVLLTVSLVRDVEGRPLHFVSHVEDISDRKRIEEASEPSLADPLTGLANRTLLMDHIELALARLRRRSEAMGVLFLDLDRFKVVNDSLGHAAGDRLLMQVAGRLRATVRAGDTVARLGGDSFAVLSEELHDERDPIATAERLADAVAMPFDIDGREAFVTTSVGIVYTSDPAHDPEVLLTSAEAAMYRAKENGKARYEVFDEGMRARARERLDTESALHWAVERDEIALVYQPVVEVESGATVGAEALVRWNHPERGTIPPLDFIPLAEETGLILPIGRWVIEEACRQMAQWRAAETSPTFTMSVNLSAVQLAHPDLPDIVAGALAESGVSPSNLCLEVTESVAMQSAKSMAQMLKRLRALGVSLAIDDFGTGYSSLSYLRDFPFDVLKIDRSFVETLGKDPQGGPIVGAVIALAQALELTTVAEGVETRGQLSELRRLGCRAAQGYLFGEPRPAEPLRPPRGLEFPIPDPPAHGSRGRSNRPPEGSVA